MTTVWFAVGLIASLIAGVSVGWAWRSVRFGLDEDCANPRHPKGSGGGG
jgi:hypothetical protein